MADITPYRIAVPQTQIDRLHAKLALTEFPTEVEDVGWDRGVPLSETKRLVEYWRNKYDWRAAEARLNKLPQFQTTLQATGYDPLKIHFVHQRSEVQNAVPLIFVHGWPGSFIEVEKILPELVKGGKDFPAFHVVAPSLPSFGFSEGPLRKGFHNRHNAEICHKLMLALGYDNYVTQGGDIGTFVTRCMGLDYPDHCKANHINMPRPNPPPADKFPELFMEDQLTPLTEEEKAGLKRSEWFTTEGFGYNLEHSTKPQTIGYSVTDSPAGLLAWIHEKLHDWTDDYPWTEDEILTWVSIYWFSTAGPAASQRIYYEGKHDKDGIRALSGSGYIPHVKLGTANFPRELIPHPVRWNRTLGELVLSSVHGRYLTLLRSLLLTAYR